VTVVDPFPEAAGEAFSQFYTPEQVETFERAVLPTEARGERPELTLAQLEAIERTLFSPTGIPLDHIATAELEDESNPDGAILLKDRAGNVTGVVSRATFEAFMQATLLNPEPRLKGHAARAEARGFAEPDQPIAPRKNRHQRRAEAARKRRARP